MIGALVGGLLQTITFVIGIKALLLIVAGLYVAALLTRPRARQTEEVKAAPVAEPVKEDESLMPLLDF